MQGWLTRFGNEPQHQFHEFTLRNHSAEVLRLARERQPKNASNSEKVVFSLVAALHDIGKVGKAESMRRGLDPDGRGREPRHTKESAKITQDILQSITWLTDAEKQRVQYLVTHHDWLGDLGIYKNGNTAKQTEVFDGKTFDQRLTQLILETESIADLEMLHAFTLADIGGIKGHQRLLTPETRQKIEAAFHEAAKLLSQREAQNAVDQKAKEKLLIDAK